MILVFSIWPRALILFSHTPARPEQRLAHLLTRCCSSAEKVPRLSRSLSNPVTNLRSLPPPQGPIEQIEGRPPGQLVARGRRGRPPEVVRPLDLERVERELGGPEPPPARVRPGESKDRQHRPILDQLGGESPTPGPQVGVEVDPRPPPDRPEVGGRPELVGRVLRPPRVGGRVARLQKTPRIKLTKRMRKIKKEIRP